MKGLIKKAIKNESGFATVVAVVMLVLFTALGLACLISVSSFLKSTQTRYYREQVKIYATSFSQRLEKELEGIENVIGGGDGQSLSKYLYENMYTFGDDRTWLANKSDGNGGFYSEKVKFSANGYESSEVQVPDMEIEMYWSCDKNLTGLSEEERYLSTTVHIKVKAIYREYEYSYESNYSLIKNGDGKVKWNKVV